MTILSLAISAEGPRGPPAPPWATAAAVGPGGGRGRGGRLGWGHIRILYKAPKDHAKPQQTVQSPKKIIQSPGIIANTYKTLDNDIKY